MTYSPAFAWTSFIASEIFDLSYASIDFNMSTYDKNSSYFSLFLYAASLTIILNVYLSNSIKVTSVFAMIVAALGQLYNKANSPKDSPGLYTFRCLSSLVFGNLL